MIANCLEKPHHPNNSSVNSNAINENEKQNIAHATHKEIWKKIFEKLPDKSAVRSACRFFREILGEEIKPQTLVNMRESFKLEILKKMISNASSFSNRVFSIKILSFPKNEELKKLPLLRYASDKELESIQNAADEMVITAISEEIKLGRWNTLFRKNSHNKNFSYQLLATHCAGKISLDELATAMTFDAAFCTDPNCMVIQASETLMKTNGLTDELNTWSDIIRSVPSNLRYFIKIPLAQFDIETQDMIAATFLEDTVVPGIFKGHALDFGVFSFAIIKNYHSQVCPESTNSAPMEMVPILHLTPQTAISEMMDRILRKQSDYGIFLREESLWVHGSQNPLFASIHDVLHLRGRKKNAKINHMFFQIIGKIQELIIAKTPELENKLCDEWGELARNLKEKPTIDEAIAFLAKNFCEHIIDGTVELKSSYMSELKMFISACLEIDRQYLEENLSKWNDQKLDYSPIKQQTINKILSLLTDEDYTIRKK